MNCPSCGSPRVHASRLRNSIEKIRSRLTDKQPFRCHQCSWRAWLPVDTTQPHADVQPDDLRTGRSPKLVSTQDLDPLDPPR
jgi:hypothetical protein